MSPLRRWLGLSSASESPEPIEDHLAGHLDSADPPHARFLAACAAVLARVAYADRTITQEESEVMTQIIQQLDDVPRKDAELIVAIARAGARRLGSEEGVEAAHLLGVVATHAQRVGLLRCLFAVAQASDGVSTIESKQIELIGAELRLSPAEIRACEEAHPGGG